MNTEMERRIVAMYFDNKDFEKNAKKTIDTLGELKDNLNLEDAVRGFDELNRAGKKLNLEDAKNSVRTLKDSLSGLKGAFQKALDIGTAPLRALDRFFDTFRGYVAKFAGYDLAWKFVQNFENAIRQLTIAPIEAGWNMYQQNMDSIRTIMSGTMSSYSEQMQSANADWTYDEGEHIAFVKGELRELSAYAQRTVYSLSDMTNNVGRFTNQNIPLKESVMAMEGIANMTAKAGRGAQEASSAMYNFSQALGVGYMGSIDWRSIENAGLATPELKNLFIQTAEAAGRLEKVVTEDASGKKITKYFMTVDKAGKKLAKTNWVEINDQNFRDTLREGWLDKQTMMRVFQIYSNQVRDIDTLAAWGFDTSDEELVNYLFGIGEAAERSATEVRTFQKMWDAMTEAVQSGWAESMEWIFGDVQEATAFWTTVNDKISEVLDRAAENRNNLLREWRGYTYNENTGEWERLEGAVDGREDLIQGIYGVIDAAKDLGGAFSSAWSSVFGSLTGEKLQSITRGFREFIDKFRGWLGNLDDTGSRISKIRNGLSGVFNILKIGWTILKGVFNLGLKMIKPLLDPLLSFFGKFGDLMNLDGAKNLGDMLRTLRDRFSELWNGLKSLGWEGVFGKIGEALGHLWDIIWGGISDFLDDSGLSGVKEWLISIGGYLQEGYQAVKSWWESSGIPEFFQGIWNAIVDVFMPRKYDDRGFELNEPGDSPIVAFFKNTWEGIRGFFEEVQGWPIWGQIGSFFSGVWNTIVGAFTPEKYDSRGFELNTPGDSPIVAFFRRTWDGVSGFFNEVIGWPIWGQIGSFFSGIWNTIVGAFTPEKYDSRGFELNTPGDSPIVAFFKSAWEGISGFFNEVIGWPIWGQIGGFFSGVWSAIVGAFTPEEGMRYNGSMLESYTKDSPVVAFFKNTWEGIRGFFEEVQGWPIWGQIGSFFSGVWNTIMNVFTPQKQYDSRGFELNDPGDSPIVAFFKNTWGGISDFFGQVMGWPIWSEIGGFFTEVWQTVSGWFGSDGAVAEMAEATGETADAIVSTDAPSGSDTNERVGLLERIINAISGFIQQIMAAIDGVVIPPEISSFLKNLGDILMGLFNFINRILGHLANMATGKGSFGEWAVALFIGILAIAGQIFNYFHTKHLGEIQTESFATKFMNLGLGLLAVAAALALLTTIDQDKMWSAVGALALMGAVMGVIIGLLNRNAKNNTELANAVKETPTERVLTRLIGAIEKVGMIAVALALLPGVIKAFGEAKQMAPELEGADILETLIGLTTLIAGVSLALAAVSRLTGGKGIDPMAALRTATSVIGVIGVVLVGILGAGGLLEIIDGITDAASNALGGGDVDTVGKLRGALEKVKVLTDGLADIFNGFFTHLFGIKSDTERQDEALANLNALAEVSDRFDLETTSGILRIMTMMTHLTELSEKMDTGKMTEFATAMEQIALGILKFSWIIGGVDDIEGVGEADSERYRNFMGAIDLVRQTVDAFSGLEGFSNTGYRSTFGAIVNDFTDFANDSQRLEAFVNGLNNVIDSMGGLHDGSNVNFDGIAIVNSMYEAIQTALTDPELPEFDATRIVDAILKAIGQGDAAIQFAIHNMVQRGINASNTGEDGQGYNFDASQILGLMSGSTSGLGGLNDTMNQYTEVLYGKGGSADNPSEDSLLGMFTGFSSKMDSIEFPDMSTKLTDAFRFKDPETGENMDLTASLQETLGSFQEELNNGTEFEIKIVPTFDLSNLTEESLRTALGDYPVGLPLSFTMPESMKVDFTGLAEAIDVEGLKSLLGNLNASILSGNTSIVTAIQQMESRINSVASAIYNLKLYLDTGVLVGGITPLIDRELGRRANQASRTGVTSMLNNPYAYMRNSNQNQ